MVTFSGSNCGEKVENLSGIDYYIELFNRIVDNLLWCQFLMSGIDTFTGLINEGRLSKKDDRFGMTES